MGPGESSLIEGKLIFMPRASMLGSRQRDQELVGSGKKAAIASWPEPPLLSSQDSVLTASRFRLDFFFYCSKGTQN